MVPINKTLDYDAVLYLKAFLCASASSKKNEVRKNLDEHITDLGAIIEACSHGQANAYPVRLILGFGVLAEECAGCDHRTHVRWQIMAFFDSVWLLQWPASPISRY